MSQRTVDYFLTVLSPFVYLGGPRFARICATRGATPVYRLFDGNAVIVAGGGQPLAQRSEARRAYRLIELKRIAEHVGLPINLEPRHFPTDWRPASRMVRAIIAAGKDPRESVQAISAAVWAQDKNVADLDVLKPIADAAGIDVAAFTDDAAVSRYDAEIDADTKAAIDSHVFGAPFYVYRGEPFWGQDRLDYLDRALARG